MKCSLDNFIAVQGVKFSNDFFVFELHKTFYQTTSTILLFLCLFGDVWFVWPGVPTDLKKKDWIEPLLLFKK